MKSRNVSAGMVEWLSIAYKLLINVHFYGYVIIAIVVEELQKAYSLSKQSLRLDRCLSIYIRYIGIRGLDSCCRNPKTIPFSHLIRQARGTKDLLLTEGVFMLFSYPNILVMHCVK